MAPLTLGMAEYLAAMFRLFFFCFVSFLCPQIVLGKRHYDTSNWILTLQIILNVLMQYDSIDDEANNQCICLPRYRFIYKIRKSLSVLPLSIVLFLFY